MGRTGGRPPEEMLYRLASNKLNIGCSPNELGITQSPMPLSIDY